MIEPITQDQMQRDYLFALHQFGKIRFAPLPRVSAEELVKSFAAQHNVSVKDLKGRSRLRSIAWVRQDCMAMLRRETNLSLPQIGAIFGRDHSTVKHGVDASEWRSRT